jgi:hypothetical protein
MHLDHRPELGNAPAKRTLLVGAAAGLAMAAVEMIYGWASSAHTAWDAPMGIWSYIGGLDHFGRPTDHIGPIVLGIGGHMFNAIFVAVVFVALMRLLRNPPGAVILGASYGAGLWALQRYVFLPINTPEDRLFTTGLISPLWVWWIAHLALGTTIGLVYMLLDRRAPAMAMPNRLQVVPPGPAKEGRARA